MRKRLFEQAKVVQAVPPNTTVTAETLFNNVASGGTNGIDTKFRKDFHSRVSPF